MEIDEAYADSLAPNAGAIKNARGVVLKRKLVGLFRSPDGTLLFGDCKGSGADNYKPSADFSDPAKPVFRCTCPSHQFPCKHSLALLYAHAQGAKFVEKDVPADISEKRTKMQQRAEKKKEDGEKPHKVNTSALKKKIEAQLKGIELLESLVNDLMRAGLGTLNAKSARQMDFLYRGDRRREPALAENSYEKLEARFAPTLTAARTRADVAQRLTV